MPWSATSWLLKGVDAGLGSVEAREQLARESGDALLRELQAGLAKLQSLRAAQHETESALEAARLERERTRAEMVALDALQKAALGDADRDAGPWLNATGLAARPRVAAQIEVDKGWEGGVEAVLGEMLEAVHVDSLDTASSGLAGFATGRLMLIEAPQNSTNSTPGGTSLASHVRGPQVVLRRLSRVGTATSLQEALARRHQLGAAESLVTPDGTWVGRDWLRVVRGGAARAGVLERETRIRALRGVSETREADVSRVEDQLRQLRLDVAAAETGRDAIQQRIQSAHRDYSEAHGLLEATRARSQETALRLDRIDRDAAELQVERERTLQALTRARQQLDAASSQLERLELQRTDLETERDDKRAATGQARERADAARSQARELLIQLEGRRSGEASLAATLSRMQEQRDQLAGARGSWNWNWATATSRCSALPCN